MKFNLKEYYYRAGAFVTLQMGVVNTKAFAQDNPFAAIEDKGNELINFFTGTLATTILALIIIICTALVVAGRMSWQKAVPIGLGAIVIGASVRIAEWLMSAAG